MKTYDQTRKCGTFCYFSRINRMNGRANSKMCFISFRAEAGHTYTTTRLQLKTFFIVIFLLFVIVTNWFLIFSFFFLCKFAYSFLVCTLLLIDLYVYVCILAIVKCWMGKLVGVLLVSLWKFAHPKTLWQILQEFFIHQDSHKSAVATSDELRRIFLADRQSRGHCQACAVIKLCRKHANKFNMVHYWHKCFRTTSQLLSSLRMDREEIIKK